MSRFSKRQTRTRCAMWIQTPQGRKVANAGDIIETDSFGNKTITPYKQHRETHTA